MIRTLIRLGLLLAGNAIGLWVASLVLDDMSVSGAAFIVAVVIFTVLEFVLQPLISKTTEEHAPALQSLSALITTFLALVITAVVSDGLDFDGVLAWVFATLIVWLVTMIVGVLLVKLFLKDEPAKK